MTTNNGNTNANRYPYRATFAKLPSGEWGCQITGTAPAVGEPVTVLKRGGGAVRKALGELVRADATRGDLYAIADLAAAPAPAPAPVEAPAPAVAGVDAWTRGALAALRSRLDVTEARLESVESSLDAAEQTIAAQARALDVALRALDTARDLLTRATAVVGEPPPVKAPAPVPEPVRAPLAERPVTGRATRTPKASKRRAAAADFAGRVEDANDDRARARALAAQAARDLRGSDDIPF